MAGAFIFLDVDGTLNTKQGKSYWTKKKGTCCDEYGQLWCPKAILYLNRLTKKYGATLVLTSTWRLHRTIEELRMLFAIRGVEAYLTGCTPVTGTERGQE